MRRTMKTQLLVLLMTSAIALLLAGCGGDEGSGGDQGGSSATATESASKEKQLDERAGGGGSDPGGTGPQATAELRVRVEQVGSKSGAGIPIPAGISCSRKVPASCVGTIACPVAEDAKEAATCRWLASADATAALRTPRQPDEICTQIYGGPETATVSGTLDGKPVKATFTRENGCAVTRFDAAAPLWAGAPPAPGAPPGPPPAGSPGSPPAAGGCPAEGTAPPGRPQAPEAPVSSRGNPADDSSCGPVPELEPEVISDPPEAFE